MLIDLYDSAEMTRQNDLKPVTDPIMFVRGSIPSPNGLVSTDIFGVSMRDRKETFAYIDLHGIFLQPYIYKLLKRIDRNFEACVHGSKTFKIVDGKLSEDETGSNGIEFLYDNWSKFKFESTDIAGSRELRVHVLKNYTKNELFTRYWIVMPAFYRDVNFENMDSGKISHRSEINDKYTKLIRLSAMLESSGGGFDFVLMSTKAKIQDTLVEIYDFLKSKLAKKEGMLRRNLLGKSTDYASRCVISAPTFHANTPEEMPIDYYHTGVPLSHVCSMFSPFIVAWIRNKFRQLFETSSVKFPVKTKDGVVMYEVEDPANYFNDELIKKEIDNFIKNFHDRFKLFKVPAKSPTGESKMIEVMMNGREFDPKNPTAGATLNRPLTWCDILYQAAVAVTADKCVYITRYPISDYFSVFPTQIFVMSTHNTIAVNTGDMTYNHYPDIDLNKTREEISISFIDTVRMSNTYLLGLGGDKNRRCLPWLVTTLNKLCERLTIGVELF